jgi:secreted trypsin-like serine protease
MFLFFDTTQTISNTILQPQSTLPPVAINDLRSSPADNEVLTVIGFGTTFEGATFGSSVLREVNVSAVPDAICNQQYGGDVEDEIMFCGGATAGGKDSCQGDSGGPIMNSNGVQIGIVSWGQGCGDEDYSGVYSRISGAIDWINEQICELSSDPPDFCNNGDNNGGGNNGNGDNGNNGGNGSAPPGDGTIPVVVEITFDDYPEESGLKLIVQSTGQVITNRPAGSFVGDYTGIFNLPMGQDIDVELTDVFGDGLCCDYGQGGIRIAALLSDDDFLFSSQSLNKTKAMVEP